MPASKETQKFVAEELPYKILMYLYDDARAPLKALGREFKISYHTVSEVLKKYEGTYKISYTLKLNETALGFTEGRVITIKFGTIPNIEMLKERFQKDDFVQDAYLGSGDFDLLLYIVGLSTSDFDGWQFKLRVELSEYKPILKISNLSLYRIGFFPLKNALLSESPVLSDNEKRVLLLLNENSRIKLSELVKRSKLSQMRVIYIMKKLREKGIIEKYSALVQNPDKRLLVAYGCILTPVKWHQKLLLQFLEEVVKEDFHEVVNDYGLLFAAHGFYDNFYMCAFQNGEIAAKRGPEILQNIWKDESPKIEKAILTGILSGKWPFHLENYKDQLEDIEDLKERLK